MNQITNRNSILLLEVLSRIRLSLIVVIKHIIVSAALCILMTQAAYTQELPRWEYMYNQVITSGAITLAISSSTVLTLTSDPNDQQREYEEAKREFKEWFEDTKETLEEEFIQASGDAKIKAAKELLIFIIEAEKRWEAIQLPQSGTWKGKDEWNVNFAGGGIMSGKGNGTGDMTLTITRDAPGSSAGEVTGQIANGTWYMGIDFFAPGGLKIGGMIMKGRYNGTLTGVASFSQARIAYQERESDFESVFALLTAIGFMKKTGSRILGKAVAFVPTLGGPTGLRWERIEQKIDEPYEIPPAVFRKLTLVGRDEKIDLEEYLIRYFTQYVGTIDDVKGAQFASRAPNHVSQSAKARETLDLLLGAESFGHAAGVPAWVIEGTGLAQNSEGSLYDKWFQRWFVEAMDDWDERVNSLPGITQAKVDLMRERFNFVIKTISNPILNFISETLIVDLALIYESWLVDDNYEIYYNTAMQLWISQLQSNSTMLQAAIEWLDNQVFLAGTTVISLVLVEGLGLSSVPPAGETILRQAAGVE